MAQRSAGSLRRNLLGSCLPWTDGCGRPWPGWRRLPLAAPAAIVYIVLSWALFVPAAARTPGNYSIDKERVRAYVYAIPDLSQDFPRALRSLATGPFLNHNVVQLVYVTLLLLLFGLAFEAREGTPRAVAFFFATSFVGAICAGVLLHLIYPELIDNEFFAHAWERTWSGGSAGCFGLMGALAARARWPWLLLGLFVLWELNVVYWYLDQFTPAFHLSALLAGFVLARYVVPPVRLETTEQRRPAMAG